MVATNKLIVIMFEAYMHNSEIKVVQYRYRLTLVPNYKGWRTQEGRNKITYNKNDN